MKKIFTSMAALFFGIAAFAQVVPNGSFETWTTPYAPDSWGSWESAFNGGLPANTFTAKDTAVKLVGLASARLKTDTITAGGGLQTIPGELGLGKAAYASGFLSFSGIAYPYRPDTLSFSYKLVPKAGVLDTGYVEVYATKKVGTVNDSITVFGAGLELKSTTTWITGTFPLASAYSSALVPDTLHFNFYSFNWDAKQGTQMWVDDVKLHVKATNVGIVDVKNMLNVDIYPNPSSDVVRVALPEREVGAKLMVYDLSGKLVMEQTLATQLNVIDVTKFNSGTYSVRVISPDHMTEFKSSVQIVH